MNLPPSLIAFFRVIPRIISLFDARDLLTFPGFCLLGYGLYLYKPWVCWTVLGSILLIIGIYLELRNG